MSRSRTMLICIPVPPRELWRFVPTLGDVPADFMVIGSLAVHAGQPALKDRRESAKNLVGAEDISGPPALLTRLLKAWARLDQDGRAEVLRHAELLAGTT